MYIVQCALYNVHCTLCIVHYTMYIVHYTMYIVNYLFTYILVYLCIQMYNPLRLAFLIP